MRFMIENKKNIINMQVFIPLKSHIILIFYIKFFFFFSPNILQLGCN